jgi:hypothetical protein
MRVSPAILTLMAYAMYRVFCATPGDVEEERQAFYKAIGEFNANHAMPRGVLFVSLSILDTVFDKRPYQSAINENIRSCRYYVQILEETWGPPTKNFERDYALALRCLEDPEMPMQEVPVFFKKPLLPNQVEAPVRELKQKLGAGEFSTASEFKQRLTERLAAWLESIAPAVAEA